MDQISPLTRARLGRPTRKQAEARHNELLEAALDHFLEKGFEQATIEAIAQSVGMTKRTVYAKYQDKVALFRAAVSRAIERLSIAPEQFEAADCGNLEQSLRNIAWLRINRVMTPDGLRLQRIINTESYRFPGIFNEAFEIGTMPSIKFLAALLERETKVGRLAISNPTMAANIFITMVVSGPVRIIVSGNPLSQEAIEERVNYAVRLFLDGALPR